MFESWPFTYSLRDRRITFKTSYSKICKSTDTQIVINKRAGIELTGKEVSQICDGDYKRKRICQSEKAAKTRPNSKISFNSEVDMTYNKATSLYLVVVLFYCAALTGASCINVFYQSDAVRAKPGMICSNNQCYYLFS